MQISLSIKNGLVTTGTERGKELNKSRGNEQEHTEGLPQQPEQPRAGPELGSPPGLWNTKLQEHKEQKIRVISYSHVRKHCLSCGCQLE